MPAGKSYKRVVATLLFEQQTPFSSRILAQRLGKTSKSEANVISHHLLSFWRAGTILRSEKEIDSEYYYVTEKISSLHAVNNEKIRFVTYSKTADSRLLKQHILSAIKTKNHLTTRQIASCIKKNVDTSFIKKIDFHLNDLVKKGLILRTAERPFAYYTTQQKENTRSYETLSLPSRILTASRSCNSFFAKDITELLSQDNRYSFSPQALSNALRRLVQQEKIVSTKEKFGARCDHAGYLYSTTKEQLKKQYLEELSSGLSALFVKKRIRITELSLYTNVSLADAFKLAKRIAIEFDLNIPQSPHDVLENSYKNEEVHHE